MPRETISEISINSEKMHTPMWHVVHDIKWRKSWTNIEDPCGTSLTKFVWSPVSRIVVGEMYQDLDFACDFEDSKSTSGGVLCIFGSRTNVIVSWMCKKQTSVSHSSTQSEIISLGAGLRMNGLLALHLCVTVIEVLRSTNNTVQPDHTSIQETGTVLDSENKTQLLREGRRFSN